MYFLYFVYLNSFYVIFCTWLSRLKERCERAEAQNTECSLLQSQVQGAELKGHDMKMELNQQQEEVQNLKKEQQDLNQLIAFQQQRLAEQQQEIQQKVSELHSLEEILQRLHLREARAEQQNTSP